MGIIGRLSNIIKGKANKALDSMEDPTEQLDLSIREKKEALKEAKRQSAELIGSVITKENNIKELEESLKEYDSAIKRALGNNDETAAEKILSKRIEKENELALVKKDYETTKNAAEQIKVRMKKLDSEIEALQSNSANLKARYKTAQAQGKVNELLSDLDKKSNVSVSDIEEKVQAAENYANGLSAYTSEEEDADISKYMNGSSDVDLKSRLDQYRS